MSTLDTYITNLSVAVSALERLGKPFELLHPKMLGHLKADLQVLEAWSPSRTTGTPERSIETPSPSQDRVSKYAKPYVYVNGYEDTKIKENGDVY